MGVFEIYPLKSEAQLVFLTQHAQARGNNISESGNILPNKVKENDFHWSLQKANARDWRWDDFSFMQKITNKLWSISTQEMEGIQTISLQPLPPPIIHHALLLLLLFFFFFDLHRVSGPAYAHHDYSPWPTGHPASPGAGKTPRGWQACT